MNLVKERLAAQGRVFRAEVANIRSAPKFPSIQPYIISPEIDRGLRISNATDITGPKTGDHSKFDLFRVVSPEVTVYIRKGQGIPGETKARDELAAEPVGQQFIPIYYASEEDKITVTLGSVHFLGPDATDLKTAMQQGKISDDHVMKVIQDEFQKSVAHWKANKGEVNGPLISFQREEFADVCRMSQKMVDRIVQHFRQNGQQITAQDIFNSKIRFQGFEMPSLQEIIDELRDLFDEEKNPVPSHRKRIDDLDANPKNIHVNPHNGEYYQIDPRIGVIDIAEASAIRIKGGEVLGIVTINSIKAILHKNGEKGAEIEIAGLDCDIPQVSQAFHLYGLEKVRQIAQEMDIPELPEFVAAYSAGYHLHSFAYGERRVKQPVELFYAVLMAARELERYRRLRDIRQRVAA